MIESGTQPGIDGVALLALGRESGGGVVGSVRLLESFLVAGIALNRESLKLSNGFALVAIGAIQTSVSADQREAIFVFADSLQHEIPALHGMTLLAIGTHLTAVDVGVAVGAGCAGIGKHWFGVALGAGDAHVHAAQGISSGVVIELRYSPYRLPTHRGMAILARNAQVAMRAARYH